MAVLQIGDLSVTWQLVSLIGILIIGLLILSWIVFVKRPREQKPSADPLLRTVFIAGIIIFIIIVMDVLVFTETEFVKKYGAILFPAMIILIAWINYRYIRKIHPMKYEKLRDKAFKWVKDEIGDEVYTGGPENELPLKGYKEVERIRGDPATTLSMFLLITQNKAIDVLLILDSFNARQKLFIPYPSIELRTKMFGKEVAESIDVIRQELIQGLPTSQLKPTQQPAEEINVAR